MSTNCCFLPCALLNVPIVDVYWARDISPLWGIRRIVPQSKSLLFKHRRLCQIRPKGCNRAKWSLAFCVFAIVWRSQRRKAAKLSENISLIIHLITIYREENCRTLILKLFLFLRQPVLVSFSTRCNCQQIVGPENCYFILIVRKCRAWVECSGFERWPAGWKAQINPLNYWLLQTTFYHVFNFRFLIWIELPINDRNS